MIEPAPSRLEVVVAAGEAGLRLDRVLAQRLPEMSRTRLQSLIRDGHVALAGGTIGNPSARVKPGDVVVVSVPAALPAEPAAEAIALDVVFEDAHVIVIDKPAGLVVHPAAGHATGTLVNALIAHCGASLSGIGGVKRPGIVHRLDKDTSGLLVVAKTDAAHQALARQFAAHGSDGALDRAYLALVWGRPDQARGRIDKPLARSASNRTKIAVARSGGRRAVTHFQVVESFADAGGRPLASLVQLQLETGRTHQIRVHLASIGHPVLSDTTYGGGYAASARRLTEAARQRLAELGRQALHAALLSFMHPVTRCKLRFESPLPSDIAALLGALRSGERAAVPKRTNTARRRSP